MTKQDIAKLAQIYHDDAYRVLGNLAGEMAEKWSKVRNGGTTEFAYLKAAIEKEAKAEGLREFLNEIENLTKNK